MLDINITLLIQLGNFIVTLVVLDFLLIKPIRGILQKRRAIASGLLTDAESFAAEAATRLEGYEAALATAREEAAQVRERWKSEAMARETGILDAARHDAQSVLRTSREETESVVSQALAGMEKQMPKLADLAVARLIGKSGR